MNDQIRRLLDALDAELARVAAPGERLDLYHLGRSALVLHYGAKGISTQDVDVVQMGNSELENKAIQLFGKGTPRAKAIGLFLDPVPQAMPPLPQWFRKRCTEISGAWRVIRLWKLEVHDLAATKLKSFRPQDRQDLQALCDEGFLDAKELRKSFDSAFLWTTPKDGDPDRDRAERHLERVIDYLEGTSDVL